MGCLIRDDTLGGLLLIWVWPTWYGMYHQILRLILNWNVNVCGDRLQAWGPTYFTKLYIFGKCLSFVRCVAAPNQQAVYVLPVWVVESAVFQGCQLSAELNVSCATPYNKGGLFYLCAWGWLSQYRVPPFMAWIWTAFGCLNLGSTVGRRHASHYTLGCIQYRLWLIHLI